jgi:hypothetical protein
VAPDPWRHRDGLRTCPCRDVLPVSADVSDSVPFDIQVKLHNNPGRLYQVDVQAFNDAYGMKLLTSTDRGFTCPTGDCTLTYQLDAPMTGLVVDGLTEFRVRDGAHAGRG